MMRTFISVGRLEAISFILLLGVAMPLKYLMDMPAAVTWLGMAHGGLFTLYVVLVMMVRSSENWGLKLTAFALVAAIIPFGPFWFEKQLRVAGKVR
jgi:integral membrane protein